MEKTAAAPGIADKAKATTSFHKELPSSPWFVNWWNREDGQHRSGLCAGVRHAKIETAMLEMISHFDVSQAQEFPLVNHRY